MPQCPRNRRMSAVLSWSPALALDVAWGSPCPASLISQSVLKLGSDACFNGGVQFHSGIDADGDAVLAQDEINQTSVVCASASLSSSWTPRRGSLWVGGEPTSVAVAGEFASLARSVALAEPRSEWPHVHPTGEGLRPGASGLLEVFQGEAASRWGRTPPSLVPMLIVSGRSVLSRRVMQGTWRKVVSSVIPPESVMTPRAFFTR